MGDVSSTGASRFNIWSHYSLIEQVCCVAACATMRTFVFASLLIRPRTFPSLSARFRFLSATERGKIARFFQKYMMSSCANVHSLLADSSSSNLSQRSGTDWSRNSLLRHRTSLSVVIDQMTNFSDTSNSSKGLFITSSSKENGTAKRRSQIESLKVKRNKTSVFDVLD
uniref:Claspin n=1 Tax=Parascaris univalens TaxID=6257 RepID=A0A915AC37_PARUN